MKNTRLPGGTPAATPADLPPEVPSAEPLNTSIDWHRITGGRVEGDDDGGLAVDTPDALVQGNEAEHDPAVLDRTRVEIIAAADLRAVINSATGGLPDEDLSNGEAQRVARLRLLLHSTWMRLKRRLIGSEAMVAQLEAVAEQCPNFATVTALVIRAAKLSDLTQTPLSVPPLLLLGEPGIGKSHFAGALAAALGSDVTAIAGATMLDNTTLTGSNPTWKGARPGKVASALLDDRTSSPIILFDEIDKVHGWSGDRPLDALLGLLEPSDARAFQDDYLGVPMQADGIIWICTANELTPLSMPLRDRFVTIRVPPLTPAQRDDVARRIFDELNAGYGDRFTLAPAALAVARRRRGFCWLLLGERV